MNKKDYKKIIEKYNKKYNHKFEHIKQQAISCMREDNTNGLKYITLDYRKNDDRKITYHDSIFICDQNMNYNEENLLSLNLWGQVVADEERAAYTKGYFIHNGLHSSLPERSRLYQPSNERLDIFDHRFFLVNLIASRCSMMDGLFISDNQLRS